MKSGAWGADTVTYTYDASGRRTQLSLPQANGPAWVQTYAYDNAGRLTNIVSPAGSFAYQYGPAGTETTPSQLVRKLTLPNGACITNAYDNAARLVSTCLKDSAWGTLDSHAYTLNAANQRTQRTFASGNYWDYGYDSLGQLKSATGKESGGTTRVHEKFGYAYDAAGNLTYRTKINADHLDGVVAGDATTAGRDAAFKLVDGGERMRTASRLKFSLSSFCHCSQR